MRKPRARIGIRNPFRKKPTRKWKIAMNRRSSMWREGKTLGMIGGGVGLLAGTTYYVMKRQQEKRSHSALTR